MFSLVQVRLGQVRLGQVCLGQINLGLLRVGIGWFAQSVQRNPTALAVLGSNPVGTSFSSPVQTGPVVHPASCTMGTGSFLLVNCGLGVSLSPYPFLVSRSKIDQSYTSTLPKGVRGLKVWNLPNLGQIGLLIAGGLGSYFQIKEIKSVGYKNICAVILWNQNRMSPGFPINGN